MSRFNFSDYEGSPLKKYEVCLKDFATPVPFDNRHSGVIKVVQRLRFAPFSG
jgi:hypothetical protein